MTSIIRKTAAVTALAFAAALALSACEEQGPAEQLGESIDKSVNELGEAVEDAGEEVQDSAN
ncbi:MAG: hypothetical protein ACFCUT_08365 [Kiloniellaceae bacterium]